MDGDTAAGLLSSSDSVGDTRLLPEAILGPIQDEQSTLILDDSLNCEGDNKDTQQNNVDTPFVDDAMAPMEIDDKQIDEDITNVVMNINVSKSFQDYSSDIEFEELGDDVVEVVDDAEEVVDDAEEVVDDAVEISDIPDTPNTDHRKGDESPLESDIVEIAVDSVEIADLPKDEVKCTSDQGAADTEDVSPILDSFNDVILPQLAPDSSAAEGKHPTLEAGSNKTEKIFSMIEEQLKEIHREEAEAEAPLVHRHSKLGNTAGPKSKSNIETDIAANGLALKVPSEPGNNNHPLSQQGSTSRELSTEAAVGAIPLSDNSAESIEDDEIKNRLIDSGDTDLPSLTRTNHTAVGFRRRKGFILRAEPSKRFNQPSPASTVCKSFQDTFIQCIRKSSPSTSEDVEDARIAGLELSQTEHRTDLQQMQDNRTEDEAIRRTIGEEKAEPVGSWKIDYIRVEEEEEREAAKKSKKRKAAKKRNKPKRLKEKDPASDKPSDWARPSPEKTKYPNNLKIAFTLDSPDSVQTLARPETQEVDLERVFPSTGVSQHAEFNRALLAVAPCPRQPKPTRFASKELLEYLQQTMTSDLEGDNCPGCGDRFLVPAVFFQHLYRKSMLINLNCRVCRKVCVFYNKCLLRIHAISHLQEDQEQTIPIEDIDIASLNPSELRCADQENFLALHRRTLRELSSKNLAQCMECLTSLPQGGVEVHLIPPHTSLLTSQHCDKCNKYLPSKCSFTAHARVHNKAAPYVCPDCAQEFLTWSIFKVHLSRTCFHDAKTLVYFCRVCPQYSAQTQPAFLEHLVEHHTRTYYRCNQCNRAYSTAGKLEAHAMRVHRLQDPHPALRLFKSPLHSSKFFQSLQKYEEHLVSEYEFSVEFRFRCNYCGLVHKQKSEFAEHAARCRHDFGKDDMYNDKPVEDTYIEILDDLRGIKDNLNCKSCLKHGRNFKNHIDKHHTLHTHKPAVHTDEDDHRTDKQKAETYAVIEVENRGAVEQPENKDVRQTRNMKRTRESDISTHKKKKMETSLLKMKIKIVSDPPGETKEDKPDIKLEEIILEEPELNLQSKDASVSQISKGKVKTKTTEATSKPHQLISTLGIDVLSDKELISINQLKNPDAFIQGSTVVLENRTPNRCLVCLRRFQGRAEFQTHIQEHWDPSTFLCKECGARFASEPSWKKHLLLIHGIKRPSPDMYCQDLVQNLEKEAEDELRVQQGGVEGQVVQQGGVDGLGLQERVEGLGGEVTEYAEDEDTDSESGRLVIDTGEELSHKV